MEGLGRFLSHGSSMAPGMAMLLCQSTTFGPETIGWTAMKFC